MKIVLVMCRLLGAFLTYRVMAIMVATVTTTTIIMSSMSIINMMKMMKILHRLEVSLPSKILYWEMLHLTKKIQMMMLQMQIRTSYSIYCTTQMMMMIILQSGAFLQWVGIMMIGMNLLKVSEFDWVW